MAEQRLEATPDERCGSNRSPLARRASAETFGDSTRMDLVTDKGEFKRLEGEAMKLRPVPVFDLVLDDNSFVPGVVALGDRALGVVVGGHTGFLAFADVPAVANRKVRHVLRVSGVYASPFLGRWLRRRRAAGAGASSGCPSLRSCWSQGKTREEALQNIREAVELYLEPAPDQLTVSEDAEVVELS